MKRATLFLFLLVLACTSVPTSQTVRGVVTDASGQPLPGVTVTLQQHATVTDAKGAYQFAAISPGNYTLEVELAGFARRQVRIRVPVQKTIITRLESRVAENITVTAEAPVMKDAAMQGVVGGRMVAASPVPLVSFKTAEATIATPNYAHLAESGFFNTGNEKTTTFSIDVDGASYSNVRRYLSANLVPPPDAVRIEEMLNYFTYSYPQPSDGRPFAMTTEVAGCPWQPGHRLLRIGIQARSIDAWKLAPNNFVFLLDVSGSMQPPERLPLIKSALRMLVDQLRPVDSVAIVVYAGAAGLVLPPTSDKTKIIEALDRLSAGGSTAGGAGIELAYRVAKENFSSSANNRVILATDGDFNVGTTSTQELTKLIEERRKDGIYLTCIGVGTDNLNDALMESLADKGNGNYYYLDTISEGKKVFVTQLQGTLVTVADDVKVQLEFNPAVVSEYRQIGYENRALANKDFEDDSKDAGELGSGHSVTALYEIATKNTGSIGTLRLRYKEPSTSSSRLMTASIVDDGKSAYEGSPDMQFATAVAEFGMLLRNSKYKGNATYADVLALARVMRGTDIEGYREEFLRLVETSRSVMGETRVAAQ